MARPQKATVDYFPHMVNHGRTMFVLESKFGNDGYAFWFKLLEMLGGSEGHFLDCRDVATWEFLLAKTRMEEVPGAEILSTLASLGAIDPELWRHRIIFSANFVEGVRDAYSKRKAAIPTREQVFFTANITSSEFPPRKPPQNDQSGGNNGESKVEERKEKEIKGEETPQQQKIRDSFEARELYLRSTFPHADFEIEREKFVAYHRDKSVGADPVVKILGWFQRIPKPKDLEGKATDEWLQAWAEQGG